MPTTDAASAADVASDSSLSTSFASDVRHGLSAHQKTFPPKWFYDELGSALFEAICALPEYYPTRAENALLLEHADRITEAFGSEVRLIELGCGSARKTRHLLRAGVARQSVREFVAVDVDASMLERTTAALGEEFTGLATRSLAGDFMDPHLVANATGGGGRNVVMLLGSTIGNLDRSAAITLLSGVRGHLQPGDAFFLGADLVKDRQVLVDAYDDPTGVTAAFNLNVLGRINRELGGDFDLRSFAHRALYNEADNRIEMHLVSSTTQQVRIDALNAAFAFVAGETIHTENSHKYTREMLQAMAAESGFALEEFWTDGNFADVLLRA